MGVGATDGMNVAISHFKNLQWKTHRGYARSLNLNIVLLDEELTRDLAHDRQLLLSQKYVTVIRVR